MIALYDLPQDVLGHIFEYDDSIRNHIYSKVITEMMDNNEVLAALVLDTDPFFRVSSRIDVCLDGIAKNFHKKQLVGAYKQHVRKRLPQRGITKRRIVQRLYEKLLPVIEPLYYRDEDDDTPATFLN
jgi:hypothetical protein